MKYTIESILDKYDNSYQIKNFSNKISNNYISELLTPREAIVYINFIAGIPVKYIRKELKFENTKECLKFIDRILNKLGEAGVYINTRSLKVMKFSKERKSKIDRELERDYPELFNRGN